MTKSLQTQGAKKKCVNTMLGKTHTDNFLFGSGSKSCWANYSKQKKFKKLFRLWISKKQKYKIKIKLKKSNKKRYYKILQFCK